MKETISAVFWMTTFVVSSILSLGLVAVATIKVLG